jgi:ribosomal protein S18 acetylase RimI-like enzyme
VAYLVEEAKPEDVVAVREISQEIFSAYGDYARLLPRFFSSQGVTSYVAREGARENARENARETARVVGFLLLGFLPWTGGDGCSERWIADVLALGVRPSHQRKGIGKALMTRMLQLVSEMEEWREVREVQLVCAESNLLALDFFRQFGFQVVDPHHGTYAGGQKALRLGRKL